MSHLTRSYLNIFVPIVQKKKISVRSLFSSSFTTFFFFNPIGYRLSGQNHDHSHPQLCTVAPMAPVLSLHTSPVDSDTKLTVQSQGLLSIAHQTPYKHLRGGGNAKGLRE